MDCRIFTATLRGLYKKTPACARPAAENPDVRSREREGRARALGGATGDPDLLCRSV